MEKEKSKTSGGDEVLTCSETEPGTGEMEKTSGG
jgi:hypothetical protein